MPTPYIFQNRTELLQLLQSDRTLAAANLYFGVYVETIEDVVFNGVGGNTFRAFRNLPKKPSELFRTWAINHLRDTLSSVQNITNQQVYDEYVHNSTESLRSCWQQQVHDDIGYGRAAKLVNLTLKKIVCLRHLNAASRCNLITFQRVPLDSYTIVGLKKVLPNLHIPRSATMKHIVTREQYGLFQSAIAEIASEAGVPAIYYDVLAWNMSH